MTTEATARQTSVAARITGLPRRLAPVLGLLLLAPVCAEYLSGYDDSTGNFAALLGGLFIFVPLYGCAALLIREVARRTGRGWPTILLLALAFGVLQPGLIDQAMFNPSYRDIDYLQPMREATYIPGLGISAYLALIWVTGHVIFSISAPIAVVEAFVPARGTTPWLGRFGLVVTGLLFAAAAAFVIQWHLQTERFVPSPAQLTGAAIVVVALTVAAFTVGRKRSHPEDGRPAPSPWLAGAVTFAALLFPTILEATAALLGLDTGFVAEWPGVAVQLAAFGALAALLVRWSRRQGWGPAHRLAMAGGALLTNALTAFGTEPIGNVTPTAKLTHNLTFALGTVILLAAAAARTRRRA